MRRMPYQLIIHSQFWRGLLVNIQCFFTYELQDGNNAACQTESPNGTMNSQRERLRTLTCIISRRYKTDWLKPKNKSILCQSSVRPSRLTGMIDDMLIFKLAKIQTTSFYLTILSFFIVKMEIEINLYFSLRSFSHAFRYIFSSFKPRQICWSVSVNNYMVIRH